MRQAQSYIPQPLIIFSTTICSIMRGPMTEFCLTSEIRGAVHHFRVCLAEHSTASLPHDCPFCPSVDSGHLGACQLVSLNNLVPCTTCNCLGYIGDPDIHCDYFGAIKCFRTVGVRGCIGDLTHVLHTKIPPQYFLNLSLFLFNFERVSLSL